MRQKKDKIYRVQERVELKFRHKIEDVLREISPLFHKTRTCTPTKKNEHQQKNKHVRVKSCAA